MLLNWEYFFISCYHGHNFLAQACPIRDLVIKG